MAQTHATAMSVRTISCRAAGPSQHQQRLWRVVVSVFALIALTDVVSARSLLQQDHQQKPRSKPLNWPGDIKFRTLPPRDEQSQGSTEGQARRRAQEVLGSNGFRFIITRVSICGRRVDSSYDKEFMDDVLYADGPEPGYNAPKGKLNVYSVSKFISACSYNRASLSSDNTFVTTDIDVCGSVTWNNFCDTHNKLFEIRDEVVQALERRGHDLMAYSSIVMLLPDVTRCGYSGTGDICRYPGAKNCAVWIQGPSNADARITANLINHEFGHNLFLQHARIWMQQDYSDLSDIMGSGEVCYNPPHQYDLGWADVHTKWGGSDLDLDGPSLSVTLPDNYKNPRSILRIEVDWVSPSYNPADATARAPGGVATGVTIPVLFISARLSDPLMANYGVYIYRYDHDRRMGKHTWAVRRDPFTQGTSWDGGSALPSDANLRVEIDSVTGSTATLTVCRTSNTDRPCPSSGSSSSDPTPARSPRPRSPSPRRSTSTSSRSKI